MIFAKIQGGLGNQMFQYATAKSLSERLNTELVLDLSHFDIPNLSITRRSYGLDIFNISARAASDNETFLLKKAERLRIFSKFFTGIRLEREKKIDFNRNFYRYGDFSYLFGFWQSYRYFDGISRQLSIDFCPVYPLSMNSVKTLESIQTTNSVAVHVRRGDYVTLKSASAFHGVLGKNYYMNAIQKLKQFSADLVFYVFSDDVEWCIENLDFDNPVFFVNHNADADSWQDMILMSHCHHHIIANSSFSWWSAWLADIRFGIGDRVVIAPYRWFSSRDIEIRDRFPMHWKVV